MTHTYPDGSTIEVGSGNTHPPGWTGQHGNASRPWVRVNGGEWQASEVRSSWWLRQWIEAAESAAEAMEVIGPELMEVPG